MKILTWAIYLVLAALYVLGAVALFDAGSHFSQSGYIIEDIKMDESSTLVIEHLDPTNESLVKVRAESEKVFAYQVGETYYDSDRNLEGEENLYYKDFELRSGEVAKLLKTDGIVIVTVTAERPIEITVAYLFFSGVTDIGFFGFIAVIMFIVGSLWYWANFG